MSEQELKEIWKNSSRIEQIKFDLSRLLIDLKNRMDSVDNAIRRRDRREIIAAIFGIFIFIFISYDIPFLISKIASMAGIVWFAYVIYKLSSVQNQRPLGDKHLSLPFKQQLENHKAYMYKQNHLIDSVLYWYILPPFIMNVVFILGVGDVEKYEGTSFILSFLPAESGEKVFSIAFLVVFYGLITWMNKASAARTYIPIIKEIEKVQEQLDD